MKETYYTIQNSSFGKKLRFALVSDLHAGCPREVLGRLQRLSPDYILMPGDILEQLDGSEDERNRIAFPVLAGCAAIAPTFYVCGNHEDGATHTKLTRKSRIGCGTRRYTEKNLKRIQNSGAIYLEDSYVIRDGIAFGGLASGLIHTDKKPKTDWLESFCQEPMPRVLLCHHPEYYRPYLASLPLDLVVSGHAHGGQWRFFDRGVFAPGQGLFPKYVRGLHDNRWIISTGLKTSWIPRFFNPPELCVIDIEEP